MNPQRNTLYYGDCLTVMQKEMFANGMGGTIDLIYLDPPFNSNRDYHEIYKDSTGRPLPIQVSNFTDMWQLDEAAERRIRNIRGFLMKEPLYIDADQAEVIKGLLNLLARTQPTLASYLSYMAERLAWMRVLMKDTGSVYLHCDPTASHYLKIVMDAIFGHKQFQNEFIWYYSGGGASKKRWARKHDVILFYTKGSKWTFNVDDVRTPHKWDKGQLRADGTERDYTKGKIPDDVWQHHSLLPWSNESSGYATQKPLALLERIIKASSNEGDTVLDPFCGCATTIEAAHKLGRRWVGCDIAIHAIRRVATRRLAKLGLATRDYHRGVDHDYDILGVPNDMDGANQLWRKDPYHFQKWIVEHLGGIVSSKKSGDGGIDGRIFFENQHGKDDNHPDRDHLCMALEVKGGDNGAKATDVRALISRLNFDDIDMVGLVVRKSPGERQEKNWLEELKDNRYVEINGEQYPRLQILTVQRMMNGKTFKMPRVAQDDSQNMLPL